MSGRRGFVAIAATAFALAGCGASSRAALPGAPRTVVPSGPVAVTPASDAIPSLDVLAARGATDAPLMRELLRVERAAPRSADVRADKDLCLRATFAASGPARVWFADAAGAMSGDPTTGTSGPVPPRGPVCTKKGDVLHLVVESAGAGAPAAEVTARAVIFAAP